MQVRGALTAMRITLVGQRSLFEVVRFSVEAERHKKGDGDELTLLQVAATLSCSLRVL